LSEAVLIRFFNSAIHATSKQLNLWPCFISRRYTSTFWRGYAIGREADLRFTGRGFDSWLGTIA